MDKQFNAEYLDSEMKKIGLRIEKPMSIYLIGGCSMSFRGLKETTKDIDIILKNEKEYKLFCSALFGAEYWEPIVIKLEYKGLRAIKMYKNKDKMHLDLFIKTVIKKLSLSKSMIKRAELYKKYGNLFIYLLSKEDIFLFKGLASESRQRDLPDMKMLYNNTINWKVIKKELKSQKLAQELNELFTRRLITFGRIYQIEIPNFVEIKK